MSFIDSTWRYVFALFFLFTFSMYCIFYIGSMGYLFTNRWMLLKNCSEKTRRMVSKLIRYFGKCLGILVIFFFLVPMLTSADNLYRKEVETIEGEVIVQGINNETVVYKTVLIDSQEYHCFACGKLEEDTVYQFTILPEINFILNYSRKGE